MLVGIRDNPVAQDRDREQQHRRAEILGTYVECVQCGLELTPAQEYVLRRGGHVRAVSPVPAHALTHEGRHAKAA